MTDDTLQREIDRLVDGELAKDDVRELIAEFDRTPDGWKRCALAFLEAQSWRRAFQSLTEPAGEPPQQPVAVPSKPRAPSRAVIAAVVGAAFLLGAGLTWLWDNHIAATPTPQETIATPDDGKPSTPDHGPKPPRRPKVRQPDVVGLIRVSSNGVTETAFPVLRTEDNQAVAVELTANEPTEYDLRLWERRGFRVEQHRKLVSVQLADGKAFHFPVDWVQYRYVGERVY